MSNDTTDDTSVELLPPPRMTKPSAAPPPRSTNATISGGNCSVDANGSPRSCYDCLNFAVDATSAQGGCTLNLNAQCVLKSSVPPFDSIASEAAKFGKYCEADDDKCYGCLRAFPAWLTCSNRINSCICVRKCEPASRLTYVMDTSDTDTGATRAVTMGVVIGCAMIGALVGYSCLAKRTRRAKRSPPVGSGYDVPQQASHAAYVAQCSPEVRIFQDAVVVSGADRFSGSSLPFAQVVDTTPSAPPLEEPIRAALAPLLETSAAGRSTTTATSLW